MTTRRILGEPPPTVKRKCRVAGKREYLAEQGRRRKGEPLSDAVVGYPSKLAPSPGVPFEE